MFSQKRMRENTVELPSDAKFGDRRLISPQGTSASNIPSDYHTSLQDARVSRLQQSLTPTLRSEPLTAQGTRSLPIDLCYSKSNSKAVDQSIVNNYFNVLDNMKKQLFFLQTHNPDVIKYLITLEHYRRFESILIEKHDMNMRYESRLLQENMGFIKRVCSLLKEYSLSQPHKKLNLELSAPSDLPWENEFISAFKVIKKMTPEQKQEIKSHLARVRSLPRSSILARRCDNSRYL